MNKCETNFCKEVGKEMLDKCLSMSQFFAKDNINVTENMSLQIIMCMVNKLNRGDIKLLLKINRRIGNIFRAPVHLLENINPILPKLLYDAYIKIDSVKCDPIQMLINEECTIRHMFINHTSDSMLQFCKTAIAKGWNIDFADIYILIEHYNNPAFVTLVSHCDSKDKHMLAHCIMNRMKNQDTANLALQLMLDC